MSDQRERIVTEFTSEVQACPGHVWRQEDHRPHLPTGATEVDWYVMEVCQLCRAARCDSTAHPLWPDERCLEARHHAGLDHRFANGAHYAIGGDLAPA